MRFLVMVLGALGLAASALAQDPLDSNLFVTARTALLNGRYLDAATMLEAKAFSPGVKVSNPERQLWTQIMPFMTNEIDPILFGRDTPPIDPDDQRALDRALPHDAIAEIVRQARATDVVILNEAHYSPRDRAFALDVARALRPLGFSILAAETLRNFPQVGFARSGGEQFQADGVVRQSTGFYSADPVYANFLRGARSLGYRAVSYERRLDQNTPDLGIADREQAQAENLMATLRTRSGAKMLIYVGHGHLSEASAGGDVAKMGERLKRLSGIDPLTIDQVLLGGFRPDRRALSTAASARVKKRPSIYLNGSVPLVFGYGPGAVDLQVVHPARSYRNGRPSWLSGPDSRAVAVPAKLLPTTGRRLVQAFDANEPADAVPLDQVLVEAGKPAPMLVLPRGRRVRFAMQDATITPLRPQ